MIQPIKGPEINNHFLIISFYSISYSLDILMVSGDKKKLTNSILMNGMLELEKNQDWTIRKCAAQSWVYAMVFFLRGGKHRRLSHGWGPKLWLNTPQKEGFWAMAETRDLETFSSYIPTLSKSFLWDEEWRHMWHGWLKPRCSSVNLLQGWIDNKLNQGFIGLVNNDSMIK